MPKHNTKWIIEGIIILLIILIAGGFWAYRSILRPEQYLDRGNEEFWQSHFTSAEHAYRQALETAYFPEHSTQAYIGLCRLFMYREAPNQGLEYCLAAVQFNSNNAEAEAQLSRVFRQMGNLEEAIRHGHRALQLDGANIDAAAFLAEALADQQDQSGTRDFTQVEKLIEYTLFGKKLEPEATSATGYVNQLQGNLDEAFINYQDAINQKPYFYAFYVDLGIIESSRKKSSAALEAFEHALMLYPESVRSLQGRGWIYWENEDFEKAQQDFQQAIILDGQVSESWAGLGWSYLGDQEDEEARRAFEQALSLDPENNNASVGLETLEAQKDIAKIPLTQTTIQAETETIDGKKTTFERSIAAAVQVYALKENMDIYSTCSGALVTSDGYILTSGHCVSDTVTGQPYNNQYLSGIGLLLDTKHPPERLYRAKTIEIDSKLDIALLKIVTDWEGNSLSSILNLTMLPIGDSETLKTGDEVWTIGFPGMGGETLTMTRGVISGFAEKDGSMWIKTDLMTGTGSSGGMVVNDVGELVGIHTQSWSDQGEANSRLSVECPIDAIQPILEKIIK